jgi:hypothetical protein
LNKLKFLNFLLIDLELNDITDQGFIYLMQVIGNLQNIENLEINMTRNSISDNGFGEFIKCIDNM